MLAYLKEISRPSSRRTGPIAWVDQLCELEAEANAVDEVGLLTQATKMAGGIGDHVGVQIVVQLIMSCHLILFSTPQKSDRLR